MEVDDAEAIYNVGCFYCRGVHGPSQDYEKAIELWLRAVELGHVRGYCALGVAYDIGRGVERDTKKATYYYELGAMGGDIIARHNLGAWEENEGNIKRA